MIKNEFTVEILTDKDCLIHVGKILDNTNAVEFSSILMDLYDDNRQYLIINMKNLEFLSSSGIGSILGVIELFRKRDGDIVLVNVGKKIKHLIETIDLLDYLKIYSSTEEALSC